MAKKESEVAQSCPTLCDPMDCSLPGSSVHGIFQARILGWVPISFSRRSSWSRDWTWVSHFVGRPFTVWATREIQQLKSSEICIVVPYKRRRHWHPTLVLLPGKSHGRRSLVGCSPWGRKESNTTEQLHFHFSLSCIGEGHGNPLQCSCLENPRDGGAQWAAVCGVAQSRTRLKRLSSSSSSSSTIKVAKAL